MPVSRVCLLKPILHVSGFFLGIYFVLGILVMFIFRNSKFGSILGKGKE